MPNRKLIVASILLLGFFAIPVLYTNCAAHHEGGASSLGATSAMKPIFKQTFHPFLVTNCSSCHVRNGEGNGKFASPSVDDAYDDFYYMGYAKIAEYAVSPNHNYPFTGPQHQEAVNKLVNDWKQALENQNIADDSNIYEVEPHFILSQKLVGLNAEQSREIFWSFPNNIISKSQDNLLSDDLIKKIRVGSQISLVTNVTGQVGYAMSSPEIFLDADAPSDLMITGGIYNLNGELVKKNTFYSLKTCVRKGESARLSNTGSLFIERIYQPDDRVGIALLHVEATTCPEPDALPKLRFKKVSNQASISIPEGSTGDINTYKDRPYPQVEITVELDQAPKVPVYFGIVLSNNTDRNAKPRCCITLDEEELDVNRGDWDFDFTRVDMVFNPPREGEDPVLLKTIVIPISDDERKEDDETFVLEFANVVNAEVGDTPRFSVTILDAGDGANADRNDGVYLPDGSWLDLPPSAVTSYSKLYGEIFNSSDESKRCIGCHNSEIRAGGYDVTDYKQMFQSGVVIPGDTKESDFIRRIVDWDALGLNPMPLNRGDGQNGSDPEWHTLLKSWVQQGARNN
jgi:hypothetical protein